MLAGIINWISNFKIPESFIAAAVFYAVAGLTLLAAILTVTLKNIFHGAIALAVTLIGVACVYLFLNSEFLAIMQILLYVGAILTLIIFAVMLTARINDKNIRQTNEQKLISFVICAALFVVLAVSIRKICYTASIADKTISFKEIGFAVLKEYVLPFEFISILLLAALIGAIALAFRSKGDNNK